MHTMDRYMKIFYTSLAVALVLLPGVRGLNCTESQPLIVNCSVPLDGYEYMEDNPIVPTMEPGALNEHCRRYDIFEDCMADVKPQCDIQYRLHYDGIEAFYQYLCHDGYDEYLKYRACFTNKELHVKGDSCNHTLSVSRSELSKDDISTVNYKRKRICQYTQQYLECVDNAVELFCGADAAKWQRTLNTKTLQPTLDAIGCSLGPSPSYAQQHWKIITISVLLSLSLVIVVVSGGMIVTQKRQKRRRPTTNHVSGDEPPPYVGPSPYMVYNPSGQSITSQNGALPEKSQPEAEPPPYAGSPPEIGAAHAPTDIDVTPGDSAVAAGYFGVDADVTASKTDREGLPKYQTLD